MSDFTVSPELLGIFLEDARGHLESLDHCLLSLERDGFDPELVAEALGPLHTLKGNSGMIGFTAIKEYVHRLEDVFAQVGDRVELVPTVFDSLFAGASALRDAIEQACREKAEVKDLRAERQALDKLLAPAAVAGHAAIARGEVPQPPSKSSASATAPREDRPQPPREGDSQYAPVRSNMVRVDFGALDHLLNLVGELIIYRTKLEELGRQATGQARDHASRDLLEAVHQVGSVSAQLQETVMEIRMLPIRHVFERFPRMVRDLARQQGKQIELILDGENTRVDKAIIDEIGEPLVHLIRNSIDHGIESPDLRVANGKTPTGTVLLSASQESNHVVITIMDDGAGIDAATVRQKALDRGLLKSGDLLSDREVVHFIFAPGFSTAGSVSDLSGRGVGLDVVLRSIERMSGLVEVETVPGVGTKFIIQLPLTLAIISALLVQAAGRTYALPLSAVIESVKLKPEEIQRINGRDTLRLRERIVPLVRLTRLFGLPRDGEPEKEYVVILGRGEKRIGLLVDRLSGQQEVVIKALDPAVSGAAPAVAGATIMGDGSVVLILDVAALFENRRHGLIQTRDEVVVAAPAREA